MPSLSIIKKIIRCFSPLANAFDFFVRPESSIKPLDGVRAFSISYVILFHSFMWGGVFYNLTNNIDAFNDFRTNFPSYLNWVWHGGRGVDIFFVLSGFLIGTILMKEKIKTGRISLSTFYLRRIFRLMPLYLVAIFVFYTSPAEVEFRDMYWANILYINNFLSFDEVFMNWTWSLAVEEQFYLVFPLFLIFIFFKYDFKIRSLIFLFIGAIMIRLIIILSSPELLAHPPASHLFPMLPGFDVSYVNSLYDNLYSRFGPLIVGVLSGYLYLYKKDELEAFFFKNKIYTHVLLILSVIIIIAIVFIPIYRPDFNLDFYSKVLYEILNENIFSVAISYIILGMLFPAGVFRLFAGIFSLRIWYPLAQGAYSLYLFHIAVVPFAFIFVHKMFGNRADVCPMELFLVAIFTIIFTLISYGFFSCILIERPFMNMRSILFNQ